MFKKLRLKISQDYILIKRDKSLTVNQVWIYFALKSKILAFTFTVLNLFLLL